MRKFYRILFFAVVLIGVVSCRSVGRYGLSGTVYDVQSGLPVSDALVILYYFHHRVDDTPVSLRFAKSGFDGRFLFVDDYEIRDKGMTSPKFKVRMSRNWFNDAGFRMPQFVAVVHPKYNTSLEFLPMHKFWGDTLQANDKCALTHIEADEFRHIAESLYAAAAKSHVWISTPAKNSETAMSMDIGMQPENAGDDSAKTSLLQEHASWMRGLEITRFDYDTHAAHSTSHLEKPQLYNCPSRESCFPPGKPPEDNGAMRANEVLPGGTRPKTRKGDE